jgi:AraC-like DNA-binding protein
MSVAARQPLPPELEALEVDKRSVLAFRHGFPSELVRWHCHDDYELHYIAASVGKVFVGDHVGAFAPGQLVMTGPRLPHNWISHTESDVVVPIRDLVVQFRQELIPSIVAAAPELNPLLVLLERSRRGIEFISPNPKESEHWFNRMIEADDAARIPLLLDFLLRLSSETEYRLLSTMPIRAEADSAALDKVDRVTSYVSDHYASDIPLATVAALVGMSESTFSRFFTKETGNGFTRFLNRVRVAKACELLGDSEVPITDICFAVGFNNVANFNRRFRELKAVTPREYRQQTRLRHNATRPAHTLG